MSTPISRRRVVTGAAWALPAVVVAGAAPAVAASIACPTVLNTVVRTGSQYAVVGFYLSAIPANQRPVLMVTVVSAPDGFAPRTPDPVSIQGGPNPYVEATVARNSTAKVSGPVTVEYTISDLGPRACTYPQLTFPYPTAR